ncbi:methyl-accepting chemotaxis protein [Xanthobacter sp. V0B-10]|uniref:methyl-accepting chemotaxis protein n=1 Tax=Xanthobacter albus TaxID=3119929 RepID=UPI0037271541
MSAVSHSSYAPAHEEAPEIAAAIAAATAGLEPSLALQVGQAVTDLYDSPSNAAVNRLLDEGMSAQVLLNALDAAMEGTCLRLSRHVFLPGRAASLKSVGRRFASAVAAVESTIAVRALSRQIIDEAHQRDLRNLKNLAGTVANVNEVSIELAYLTRNTHRATEGSQSVASAVSELVTSIEDISRSSNDALNDAQGASQASGRATQAVESLRATTVAISDATEETRKRSTELVAAFDRIADVLKVIDTIARQTNLLALNATIEAARAGDAGKGFAIVAQEVKALANQTGAATEEIGKRVDGMRAVITRMGEAMARSEEAVGASIEDIEQVSAAVTDIDGTVNTVARSMEAIATVLSQQKIASEEIGARVCQSADLSTENEKMLMRMATSLQNSNDRFSSSARDWFNADSPLALCEMAKIDHVLFKKRVVDVLMGRSQWHVHEVPDHHNCRLGKWYERVDIPAIRRLPAFTALVEPHRQVHAAAQLALRLHEENRPGEALEALTTLNTASHEVQRILEELAAGLQAHEATAQAAEKTEAPATLQ